MRQNLTGGWRKAVATVLVVLVVAIAAIVLTAKPADPALYPARAGEPTVTVYVLEGGIHSNLAVSLADLARRPGPTTQAAAMLKPQPWVYIGWGDTGLYQGQGKSIRRALDMARALFWPGNSSVVHLAGTATPRWDPSHPNVQRLVLSRRGFERLQRRVDASFSLENGRPVAITPGPAPDALFFKSNETFSILHVCNDWTGELLNRAGVASTPAMNLTQQGLALDLRHRGGAEDVPASRNPF